MRSPRVCVCVFAKPPRAGEVKTRLARDIGPGPAAAVARAFLVDTWAAVRALSWADAVVATTQVRAMDPRDVPQAQVWAQGRGDLGTRMAHVLARALRTHEAAMVIGTDAPGLPPGRLSDARRLLRNHEAVLGPAEDGGFYLLGVTRLAPGLLTGLPWSQPTTCQATRERLRASGLRVAEVKPWFDVDDLSGLRRLHRQRRQLARVAPATAAVLAQLDLAGETRGARP